MDIHATSQTTWELTQIADRILLRKRRLGWQLGYGVSRGVPDFWTAATGTYSAKVGTGGRFEQCDHLAADNADVLVAGDRDDFREGAERQVVGT